MKFKHKIVYYISILILVSVTSAYLPSQDFNSLLSPDENYNYILMKEYAEHGRLFLLEDYSSLDHENLLHPRQFVTFYNKIVPFNYVGLPVIYAPFYLFLGESIKVAMSIVLAVISILYLTKIAIHLFGGEVRYYSWLGFISCTPLIYYLNLPFLNINVAVVFFIIGTYYLIRFKNIGKYEFLILSILFYSTAIFVRYHYIIFVFFIFLVIIVDNKLKSFILNLFAFITGISVIAVLPIIWINSELYGDPFTTGFSLFNLINSYRPEYTSPFENTPLEYLFPSPIIPEYIFKNIVRLIVLFNPILFALGFYGVLVYLRQHKREISITKLLLASLFVVYVFIFRGSSYTWRSYDFDYIGFDVAILRYWILLYIFMSIFLLNGIKEIKKKINRRIFVLLLVSILVVSLSDLFVSKDHNLNIRSETLERQDIFADNIYKYITQFDNSEKIVVYTSFLDKALSPIGIDVATWWYGKDNYHPEKIASSMARIYNHNISVYLIKEEYMDIDELNYILDEKGYKLVKVLQLDWEVFKLVKNDKS